MGLYLEKSAEALACIYGVLKTGAAYVPLHGPTARLARLVSHARIRVLLTGAERSQQWPVLTGADSPVEFVVCVNGLADRTCEPWMPSFWTKTTWRVSQIPVSPQSSIPMMSHTFYIPRVLPGPRKEYS